MKFHRRFAWMLVLLLIVAAARSDSGSATAVQREPVADSMQRLAREIIAAYERRDTVALKSFYARQPEALFFWERQMTYSWEQISRTMDALVSAVAKMKLTTTEFRAGGSDTTGWFAAAFHAERTTPEGREFSSDGRWTVIAEKRGGRWLIVHEHTSFPLPKS